MKNSSPVPRRVFAEFLEGLHINLDLLDSLAIETGWQKREPRKLNGVELLAALCLESLKGTASFNDISRCLGVANTKSGPSRQAVGKRLNPSFRALVEALLNEAIRQKAQANGTQLDSFLAQFGRVILQDSTIIALPGWLYESYSGVANAHAKVCNMRLQVVYDLKAMKLLSFEICPYTKNDLAAASELIIKPGDLILRDRGYLTKGEIARHLSSQADCIYRHKTGSIYLDPESGERIGLLEELRKHGTIDRIVTPLDSPETKIRLVAAPVDEETASVRRMRAKKESCGKNPSAEVLALMDWTIFLTTLDKDQADFGKLLKIYALRWGIEMIFKAWKSHLNFGAVHRVSQVELEILMRARLLVITEGTNVLYRRCHLKIRELYQRDLSLQKFLRGLGRSPEVLAGIEEAFEQAGNDEHWVWYHLKRYCCYDKRKRQNYYDKCRALS